MHGKGKDKQLAARRPLAWPSILVACGWLAIWLLWPAMSAPPAPRDRTWRGTGSVAYLPAVQAADLYVAPDLFGLPSAVGFRAAGESEVEVPEMPPAYRAGRPHLLPLRPPVLGAACDGTAGRLAEAAGATLERYQPRWNALPLFTMPGRRDMELQVDAAAPLREREFRADGLVGVASNFADTGWQAALYTELGPDGRPAYVFVEQGSGRADLDAALVRALLQARGAAADVPAGGRVSVSWGRAAGGR